ncbi:unnamed protein product [Oncorhynchus mykiss]|uniref:26S proteasome complex subunit SEM1 n=3 Tax=Salmoninae TaxID=504568 RepID=A0A060XIN4_ONCMY|nr:unnamed protein product [Oncorhynchus mykiss]
MSDKKQTVDLGLLEEDDEFEEFPAEDWTGLDEDEDAHVWEDNWDDDNVEDDFSNQLRAELEKHGYKMETSQDCVNVMIYIYIQRPFRCTKNGSITSLMENCEAAAKR